MSHITKNLVFRVSNQSDNNQAIQPQKMAIIRLETSNSGSRGTVQYICSQNKGADQLQGYDTADLQLCLSKSRFSPVAAHTHLQKQWLHIFQLLLLKLENKV